MQKKLLLVHASSSVFRAFFAIPALANSAGVPTNAALGFTTMLQKLLRETRPDYVVVVWDSPGPKRRKAIYPAYKATRDATPEELRAQFPWIRRIVDAYRLAALEYEAYSPMAERTMQAIIEELARQHPCLFVRVTHRVGLVRVGEAAIRIQDWHRRVRRREEPVSMRGALVYADG